MSTMYPYLFQWPTLSMLGSHEPIQDIALSACSTVSRPAENLSTVVTESDSAHRPSWTPVDLSFLLLAGAVWTAFLEFSFSTDCRDASLSRALG